MQVLVVQLTPQLVDLVVAVQRPVGVGQDRVVVERAVEQACGLQLRGRLVLLTETVRGQTGELVGEGQVRDLAEHRLHHPPSVGIAPTIEGVRRGGQAFLVAAQTARRRRDPGKILGDLRGQLATHRRANGQGRVPASASASAWTLARWRPSRHCVTGRRRPSAPSPTAAGRRGLGSPSGRGARRARTSAARCSAVVSGRSARLGATREDRSPVGRRAPDPDYDPADPPARPQHHAAADRRTRTDVSCSTSPAADRRVTTGGDAPGRSANQRRAWPPGVGPTAGRVLDRPALDPPLDERGRRSPTCCWTQRSGGGRSTARLQTDRCARRSGRSGVGPGDDRPDHRRSHPDRRRARRRTWLEPRGAPVPLRRGGRPADGAPSDAVRWRVGEGHHPASGARPRRGPPSAGGWGRRRAAGMTEEVTDSPARVHGRRGKTTNARSPAGRAFDTRAPGGDLLSQGVYPQVPSALAVLTSVFGMGTGVTLPL